MTHFTAMPLAIMATACACSLLAACGGGDHSPEPVTISAAGPNAVSYWNDVATTTVNVPASAAGTAEEQRPTNAVDLATVHAR